MIYLVSLIGLLIAWCAVKIRCERKDDALRQERLSTAFFRSHARHIHGHSAAGISQNLMIELAVKTSPIQ